MWRHWLSGSASTDVFHSRMAASSLRYGAAATASRFRSRDCLRARTSSRSITSSDRRAGQLLARTGTSDAIDASVICLAHDGNDVLTSDPADLQALARAAGVHVDLISV